ncbi:MAG: FAD:protein FMN transferase, partial [Woeseiaceae bacterium]
MPSRVPCALEVKRISDCFQGRFTAMGSPCEVLVASEDEKLARSLLQIVADEAWRIEKKFSRYLPDNIVARINNSDGRFVSVDDETANLLDFAARLYELSAGRFDITSGVLRKAWTFDGSGRFPSAGQVQTILKSVGWQRISWVRPEIRLRQGMQIDLGGIGKEYAVDKAAGLLSRESSTPCLVNFGGDLVATGEQRDPHGWQVGIEAPDHFNSAQRLIRLSSGALATSGDS